MVKHILLLIAILISSILLSQNINHANFYMAEKSNLENKFNFKENSYSSNYDLVYQRAVWQVNPGKHYIKGAITSYFKPTTASVSEINFDLSNALMVDSITNTAGHLNFTHSNNILNIKLGAALNLNNSDSLTVFYQGIPPVSGFGAFTVATHGYFSDSVLWTLSEPYGASEWWPCKQSLTDKIDSIDIFVTTPSKYKVASNGKLIYEKINGKEKTAFWKHRYPIATYLVAIAVANYESYSHYANINTGKPVEILNYVYPESRINAEKNTMYTVDVLELFSEVFIPYPFHNEKYGHAEFGWSGGMEHQTMSFMGAFNTQLITHELAHQWFGNHVTCNSWQDIWVNEGFAVFCEGLATEHLNPDDWLNWKKEKLNRVLLQCKDGSVFVEDTSEISRIFDYNLTYLKGGMIIHQLRNQIGDEAFFAGINELLTNKNTSGNYASASDVKNFLEESSDTSLTWFFDQWYYGQGYPIYSIDVLTNNADSIVFTVSQETTHTSVDFFSLNVPILFKGENGTSRMKKFHNTKNSETFVFKPGFQVKRIEFDPNYTIITPHSLYIKGEGIIPSNNKLVNPDEILKISPNPFNEECAIEMLNGFYIESLEILDISGKLLTSTKLAHNSSQYNYNLSLFAPGQYLLRVKSNSKFYTKAIVKK